MTDTYNKGDVARRRITYTDEAGQPVDPDTVVYTVRSPITRTVSTPGVVQEAPGVYRVDVLLDEAGVWEAQWVSTGAADVTPEEFLATPSAFDDDVDGAARYTTRAAVRALPNVPLDADVDLAIEQAETITDELLGARPVDPDTGIKVVQADIEAWRWTRFVRFVTLLAGYFYTHPDDADGRRWQSVTGPDFGASKPVGNPEDLPSHLIAMLNGTGLRRMAMPLDGMNSRPPWWDFVRNDTSGDLLEGPKL